MFRTLSMIFVLAVIASVCNGQEVLVSRAFGKSYEYELNDTYLNRSPPWKDTAENPPLSARRAIQLADEAASKLAAAPKKYKRQRICAQLTQKSSDKWIWIVDYEWKLIEGGGSGIPNNLSIVVLMDGTLLPPTITNDRSERR